MTRSKLTPPRLRALEALAIAHAAKHKFVRSSHETHADPTTPWTFSINGHVARSLEAMGLAEGHLVDVTGRVHEPTGDLVDDLDLLNFCTTKYRITRKGRAVPGEQLRQLLDTGPRIRLTRQGRALVKADRAAESAGIRGGLTLAEIKLRYR